MTTQQPSITPLLKNAIKDLYTRGDGSWGEGHFCHLLSCVFAVPQEASSLMWRGKYGEEGCIPEAHHADVYRLLLLVRASHDTKGDLLLTTHRMQELVEEDISRLKNRPSSPSRAAAPPAGWDEEVTPISGVGTGEVVSSAEVPVSHQIPGVPMKSGGVGGVEDIVREVHQKKKTGGVPLFSPREGFSGEENDGMTGEDEYTIGRPVPTDEELRAGDLTALVGAADLYNYASDKGE